MDPIILLTISTFFFCGYMVIRCPFLHCSHSARGSWHFLAKCPVFPQLKHFTHFCLLLSSLILQVELARSLGVTQQAISKCLKAMGMIQKQGNWVPYELKREMLNGVCLLVNSCLKGKDGRDFCIALWLGTKNGFITIIPSRENHGEFPAMLPRRRPNRIFTAPRSCSVFGGTSSA